jgi:hypothetical protein
MIRQRICGELRPIVVLVVGLLVAPTHLALAQIQVSFTDLSLTGTSGSGLYGIGGSQLVGWADKGAMRWLADRSVVSLHPFGWDSSTTFDTNGREQVGNVMYKGNPHAALWRGTRDSFVDLNPPGKKSSNATAISGSQQVGQADGHAGFWNGTADSFVDLNPSDAIGSYANDTIGSQQVGGIYVTGGYYHAALWSGTAASFQNLHPPGKTRSNAWTLSSSQQAGDVDKHAALWSGSASSFVDLNPNGATESSVTGVEAGYQIGWVTIDGKRHAAFWASTAESFLDLNGQSGPDATSSFATGISVQNNSIYIVGTVNRSGTISAALWTITLPAQDSSISTIEIVGQDVRLGFETIEGKHYRMDRCDVLSGPWLPVGVELTGDGVVKEVMDVGGAASFMRFYRLVVVP